MNDFDLSDYLVANKVVEEGSTLGYVPRIVCKDGFSLSVQCHRGNYCCPRIDGASRYYEVEVGFPSEIPEFIMGYCDDDTNPTDTVYAYVPTKLVQELIEFHGGIAT